MLNDFVAFILTHGRPDNVITLKTLRKCGYTGRVVLVIDNEDKTADKYFVNFGKDNVVVFDKKKYADMVDEGNNFDDRRMIIHARNACFDIAKQLGYTYFIELDDDYSSFEYRPLDHKNKKLLVTKVRNLDNVFMFHLKYFKTINCDSFAFAQGGDYIGGYDNSQVFNRSLKRKCMNSFFCSTDRRFQFTGGINEDVNTYTTLGSRGKLFFTIPLVSLTQKQTQSNKGGMTDIYLDNGTYLKSFTTVMLMPSSVKAAYQQGMGRIHHKINWKNTVPKIIRENHKK